MFVIRSLILALILIWTQPVYAQVVNKYLTLTDLLDIFDISNIEGLDYRLSKNGFAFSHADNNLGPNCRAYVWAYGFDGTDSAREFITKDCNKIVYQFGERRLFDLLKNATKNMGYSHVKTGTSKDGDLSVVYQKANHPYIIFRSGYIGDVPSYAILIQ